MKRTFLALLLAVVVVFTTGCQCRMFRMRGARCQSPLTSAPRFPWPWRSQAAAAPGCNSGCNPAGTVVPDGAYGPGEFPTAPMSDFSVYEGQTVGRPILPSDVTVQSSGPVIVSGPEAGDIPGH